MSINTVKLRKGLFMVEWNPSRLLKEGKTDFELNCESTVKTYSLHYTFNFKNYQIEVKICPKFAIKRTVSRAFTSDSESDGEHNVGASLFRYVNNYESSSLEESENDSVLRFRVVNRQPLSNTDSSSTDSDSSGPSAFYNVNTPPYCSESEEDELENEEQISDHSSVDLPCTSEGSSNKVGESSNEEGDEELQTLILYHEEEHEGIHLSKSAFGWGPFVWEVEEQFIVDSRSNSYNFSKHKRSKKKPICRFLFDFEIPKRGQLEVLERFGNMLEEQKYCDVHFDVLGQKMGAHLAILSAGSPVLAAMFQNDCTETRTRLVKIEDIRPEVFKQLLQFIYTGSASLLPSMTEELFEAADKYELEHLRDECVRVLKSRLDVDNVVSLLVMAHLHSTEELNEACLEFLAQHGRQISFRQDWADLVKTYPDLCIAAIQRMVR